MTDPFQIKIPTLSAADLARMRDAALRRIETTLAERWKGRPITPPDRGAIERDAQAICREVVAGDRRLLAAFGGREPRVRLEWNEDRSGAAVVWA